MTFRAVSTRAVAGSWPGWLASRGVDLSGARRDLERGEFERQAAGAHGILSFLTDRVGADLIGRCPDLKLIANVAVGLDNVDVEAAARRGIWVTHTPGVLTDAVADLTWGLILAAARRLIEADRCVREGRFQGWRFDLLQGVELSGLTLGILGFGRIGQAVALRARGFGMRLKVLDRPGLDRKAWPDVEPAPLDRVLAESDVLTLHLPLTDRTRRLIGERELRIMKPTALLVNVSRGAVLDEGALVRALQEGWIAGAALDVYEREPALTPGLSRLPNATFAPHIGSATVRTRQRMLQMACEELAAVAAGEKPRHPAREIA